MLATGLVVDDAIVVLENIVRRRGQGIGPRAAAVLGTRGGVLRGHRHDATLAAVFVPLSFLPGQTGGLFREFGFTLGDLGGALGRGGAVALPDARLAHAEAAAEDQDGVGGAARRPARAASTSGCCMPASTRRSWW